MKIAILFVLFHLLNPHSTLDLPKVREAYEHASKDETVAKQLYARINQQASGSATMMGYKGAVTMVLAKFQFNPLSKLEYFNNGKSILEQAIAKDAGNIELIFIRFTVQSYAPAFLKYNKDLNRDKHFLLTHAKELTDKDLQTRITRFLKNSPHLTRSERNALHS